jgi:uncharacterized lipoprotein NlpE involved in copper resistance
MNRSIATLSALASLGLVLAGCGNRPGNDAVPGSMIDAGAGTPGTVVAGAPIMGAGVAGGAISAGSGAATSPDDIDLGRPVWE